MAIYKVTVCQVGYAFVEADSSEKAKQLVHNLPRGEFCWVNPDNQESSILVVDSVKRED